MQSENKYNNTKLGISNFKPYQDMQEMELAPITLVYGQNSGGKTSLLEALLCSSQSVDNTEIEKGYFNLSGSNISLGPYKTVKNKYAKSPYIFLKFKPKLANPLARKGLYLNSFEPILCPSIILHLKDSKKINSNILFIEKIELDYEDYLEGKNILFESNKEEYIYINMGEKGGEEFFTMHKFGSIAKYEIHRESIQNLKEISELCVKEISKELAELSEKHNNKKIDLLLPALESQIGPMTFFPTQNLISSTGILSVAAINSGGWIQVHRGGVSYQSFSFKKENKLLNKEFHSKLIEHANNINNNYFRLILENKIKITGFIDSSEDSRGRRKNERVLLKFILEKNDIKKIDQDFTNKIYIDFCETIELFFPKKSSSNIWINEKYYQLNEKNDRCNLNLLVLKELFSDYLNHLQPNPEISPKHKQKIKDSIFDQLKILKQDLLELKSVYDSFYEIIEKFNQDIFFTKIETERFYKITPIIVPKFENKIINVFRNLVTNEKQPKVKKYLIEETEELKLEIDELIRELNKLFGNLFFDINIMRLQNTISENRIQLNKEKLKFLEMYDCLAWLQNNMDIEKELKWSKNIRTYIDRRKVKQFDLIKKEGTSLPLISLNLFPLLISSKMIHLGAARSGGKRIYDFDDINNSTNADVGYFLKLSDSSNIKKNINDQLRESKIANGINSKPVDDENHDLREIIIYPYDESIDKLEDNKININLIDTGYGISQILPIIINSIILDSNTILVQQPETHLHPRLQAEVGTIIAKSIKNNKNKSIKGANLRSRYKKNWVIETHSETLLFRLLKEIRNGNLNHNQLNVLYIDHNKEKGSKVKKMLISEDGELLSQWPDGFFSTDIEEVFD